MYYLVIIQSTSQQPQHVIFHARIGNWLHTLLPTISVKKRKKHSQLTPFASAKKTVR